MRPASKVSMAAVLNSHTQQHNSANQGRAVVSHGLSSHIDILDGFRGAAILLVMIYHQTVMQSRTLIDIPFLRMTLGMWSGADALFVLSGFLITGILYDSKGSRYYFRNFYARRALRIFPLYYAIVFFSLLILPRVSHPWTTNLGRITGDEMWYWLNCSNFSIANHEAFRHGILDVCWWLAVEWQFCLIWPAVVFVFPRRALIAVCAGMIAAAPVLRTVLLSSGFDPISVYVLTPCRMDALAMGALIALVGRGEGAIAKLVPRARIGAALAGLALLIILVCQGNWDWQSRLMQTAGYTVYAFLSGAILILAVGSPPFGPIARLFNFEILKTFGRYSYALYLFHSPLRAVIRDTFFGPERFPMVANSQLPGQIMFYALATAVTLVSAVLSWHLYEKHFLKIKTLFPMN